MWERAKSLQRHPSREAAMPIPRGRSCTTLLSSNSISPNFLDVSRPHVRESTQSTDGALRALFTLCREPRSLLYLLQSSPGEEHMDIIAQLKAERDKAAQQVSALDTAIGALSGLNSTRAPRGRRTMSAAARARTAAAQRARWAKVKGQRKVVAIAPRRKISAAGLARIRAANKARWAKWRGAQK